MDVFKFFFIKHPSLYFAFGATIGAEAGLQKNFFLLLIFIPLHILCGGNYRKFFCGIILTLIAFFIPFTSFHFPEIPEKGIVGIAKITIEHLSYKSGPNRPSWIYKGIVHSFSANDIKNVPFFLTLPVSKKNRPLANADYEILCFLKKGRGKQVILKSLKTTDWQQIDSFSMSEFRFSMKQKVKHWIEEHFASSSTIQFLSGLVTGEFDDRQLRQDFGRFGLLHLLAISGFHFSILAALLELLLRPFFGPKTLSLALIISLSLYFIFLGWGPSILRAWFTLLLYFGAYFHERFSSSINSLGVALFACAFLDPLLLENLGFQFSFLTTAAILMGLQPSSDLIDRIFPKRSLEAVLKWSWDNQLIYFLLGFMKNGLSLTLATTFVALPVSLYYFETFPLLSLFYNIFYPLLVSISMGLLMVGSLFFMIPPLAQSVHYINDYFTSFILNMTYDIPSHWDFIVTKPVPSSLALILYIFIIFMTSIYFRKPNLNERF